MPVSRCSIIPLFVAQAVTPAGGTARSAVVEVGNWDSLALWLKQPAPAGAASGAVLYKWQGSKDGVTWVDMIGHARLAVAGSDQLVPYDYSLNFNDGNFGGNGNIINLNTYADKDSFLMFQNPLMLARYVSLFVTNSANVGTITVDADLWVQVVRPYSG
mgnify:FL=1